jgi:hypothetical protein
VWSTRDLARCILVVAHIIEQFEICDQKEMSGFEVAGIVLAGPAIVERLLQVAIDGYKVFQSVKLVGKEYRKCQLELNMTRVRLEDWMRGLSASGGDLGSVLGANSMRYYLALEVLVLIAETFARVEELERKYDITQTRPDVSSQQVESIEGDAPGQKKPFSVFKTLRTHLRPHRQVQSSTSSRSTSPALPTSSLSHTDLLKFELAKVSLSGSSASIDEKVAVASHSTEADLDVDAPDLADCIIEMDKKAKECQKALSSITKYQWVFSTQDELRILIKDLEKYIAYLETLTRSVFQSKLLRLPALTLDCVV